MGVGAEEALGGSQCSRQAHSILQNFKGQNGTCQRGCLPREMVASTPWPTSLFTPQSLLFLETKLSWGFRHAIKHPPPQGWGEPGQQEETAKPASQPSPWLVEMIVCLLLCGFPCCFGFVTKTEPMLLQKGGLVLCYPLSRITYIVDEWACMYVSDYCIVNGIWV